MNQAIPALRHQYLSNSSGDAAEVTSAAVPVNGNKAALSVTVINWSDGGSPSVSVQLQGSYDGLAWYDFGSALTAITQFGQYDTASGSLDYAYLRVRAKITAGTNVHMLFDATIATSEQ